MKGNFIYKRLGEKIFFLRKRKGLFQEQLSIDVDRSYIGELEQGKANPTFKVLHKISTGLKVKLSTLLNGV